MISHGKDLKVFTGNANPQLASEICKLIGTKLGESEVGTFSDGEIFVSLYETVRGSDVFVVQSTCGNVNNSLMELLIMIDALKRASAKSITVVAPFLGYSRQDKKHRGREPISCRLVFDLLKTAGADRIMSVDLHAAQSQGFFDGPVDHLVAMPVLVDYIRDRFQGHLDNVAVVSPDAGRIRVAEQWAQRLGGGPLAFVHKTRDITRPNQAVANRVVGDVAGKDCVLVDDLIDTAGTIAGACHVLQDAGAKSVTVVATHGVLSGPAIERLKNCGAREVVLTDTVPIPEEKRWDGLTVLSIAPLLASAIRAVFEDGSVAELFDTYPEHHGQGFLFA